MFRDVFLVSGLSLLMLFPYLFFQTVLANVYPVITLSVAFQILCIMPVIVLALNGWKWGLLSGGILGFLVVLYDLIAVNVGYLDIFLVPVTAFSTSLTTLDLENKIKTPILIMVACIVQIILRMVVM